MTKTPDKSDRNIEDIMNNAQTLLNFCETIFAKPSELGSRALFPQPS